MGRLLEKRHLLQKPIIAKRLQFTRSLSHFINDYLFIVSPSVFMPLYHSMLLLHCTLYIVYSIVVHSSAFLRLSTYIAYIRWPFVVCTLFAQYGIKSVRGKTADIMFYKCKVSIESSFPAVLKITSFAPRTPLNLTRVKCKRFANLPENVFICYFDAFDLFIHVCLVLLSVS